MVIWLIFVGDAPGQIGVIMHELPTVNLNGIFIKTIHSYPSC